MTIEIKKNEPLKNFTSWKIGGAAEYFCLPKNEIEIKQAINFANEKKIKISIIGGGSNVLISDAGIKGLTICLKNYSQYEVKEESNRLSIIADSGVMKSELLKIFLKHKLPPALFLAGLPGDVGGGVAMNAGVAEKFVPREFVEIIDWIEVIDFKNEIKKYFKKDLHWDYRHCNGWGPGVISKVAVSWDLSPDLNILRKVKEANQLRLSKQPLDMPSCGSVFVNPEPLKAAQLIDSCGLKGYTVGGAQISQKHANFIVNLGDATAEDVLTVIGHVKKTVKKIKNIELSTEVVFLGEVG